MYAEVLLEEQIGNGLLWSSLRLIVLRVRGDLAVGEDKCWIEGDFLTEKEREGCLKVEREAVVAVENFKIAMDSFLLRISKWRDFCTKRLKWY